MNTPTLLWLAAVSVLPVAQAGTEGTAPVLITFGGDDGAALLGVWDDQHWVSPTEAVPKVKADTGYRLQGLTGPSFSRLGGSPVSYDGPCSDFFNVPLKPNAVAQQTLIATRADLNARPRPVTVLPTSSSLYQSIIKAELQKRGLKNPQVQLQHVIRADLDGDGTAEVILEASFFKGSGAPRPLPSSNASAGDYSLLLLRSVINGKVNTQVLAEDVALNTSRDINAPRMNLRFSLEGIADLNGDGKMELITSESYYEGFTLYAWAWKPARRFQQVLTTSCGV